MLGWLLSFILFAQKGEIKPNISIGNMACICFPSLPCVKSNHACSLISTTEWSKPKLHIRNKKKNPCLQRFENLLQKWKTCKNTKSGFRIHHQIPHAESTSLGNFEEGGLAWWMRALWLAKKTGRCSHIALPVTREFLKKHFAIPMADGYAYRRHA